ncbi:Epstein-Barr virus EBNA-1-like protein [Oryza sativa Japonica Group]|uniref:Epstein-Barr virus EBNA-1-like protein n=1 Tax=Oryza sativa subsp. japonica TaxID=39947 RepID=Q8LIZ5_ORYSJ|nr:Epstein-Barr virus EBNA-1-like protein [Oryza sativa Japonica Group]
MRRAHAQPHGSRWNARTGGADRGRPDPISAELAPTWRLRGARLLPRGLAGGRRRRRPERTADDSDERRSEPRRYRRERAYRVVAQDEGRRANGSDSPEGVRRRWIAAAATGGEKRGKRRRGHEGPIPGGESIYAATGIRC